jgi:polysaccharide biosynthesis protein PslG
VLRSARALLTVLLFLTFSASMLPLSPRVAYAEVPKLDARPFGINSHIASRYPDPSSMDVPARIVAGARVGWVREDFQWFRIEPQQGEFDWLFTDQMVAALGRYDVNILGVLGPSVGWATPEPSDKPDDVSFLPPDPRLFARYAYAVAKRYQGQVDHWEIWNEPDNELFWRPNPDPVAYAELLRRAAYAIKQANPEATVLIGGMNPFDLTFMQTVHAQGAWDSFDVLNLHPYVDPFGPEDGNIAAAVDSARALANEYGAKPIWVTELGWSSGPGDRDKVGLTDEQEQADYLARAMVLLWTGGVERIFWYTLKDDPGNPYGLVALGSGRADFSRLKPAFYALRTLNRMLGGAQLVGLRDLYQRQVVHQFEPVDSWLREGAPGAISHSAEQVKSGAMALRIDYNFASADNEYTVYTAGYRPALPDDTRLLGVWVYGDGSAHTIKVWMQDANGAVVQYPLGAVGARGWHFVSAPITGEVPVWNQISGGGPTVTGPLRFFALVVDDAPDGTPSSGTFYLDDLTALSGLSAYDLRLQRGDESIDMLWSPTRANAAITTSSSRAAVFERGGRGRELTQQDGQLRFELGPSPIYVRHRRP